MPERISRLFILSLRSFLEGSSADKLSWISAIRSTNNLNIKLLSSIAIIRYLDHSLPDSLYLK